MTLMRASVLASPGPVQPAKGGPATVLVDGSDAAVTANGLSEYQPRAGDRVLVDVVGAQVEIIQFLNVVNGIKNAGFEDAVLAPHQIYNGAVFSPSTTVHNGLVAGSFALPIAATMTTFLSTQGLQSDPNGNHPRVQVDDEWVFSAWVRFSSGPTVRAQITVRDATGAILTNVAGPSIVANGTWQQVSASVKASDPNSVYVVGTLQWSDPAAKTLLVDDMSLVRKVASVLIADELTGKTITGGMFRTAVTGQRWEIDSGLVNLIRGYSGSPAETAPGYIKTDYDAGSWYTYTEIRPAENGGVPVTAGIHLREDGGPGTAYVMGGVVGLGGNTTSPRVYIDSAGMQIRSGKLLFWNSNTLETMNFGRGTFTTDASSQFVIPHGFGTGSAPLSVSLTPSNANQLRRVAIDATNITVEVRTAAGVLVGSGVSVPCEWQAFS